MKVLAIVAVEEATTHERHNYLRVATVEVDMDLAEGEVVIIPPWLARSFKKLANKAGAQVSDE